MNKTLEYIKDTKLLITTVFALFTFMVGVYNGYNDIKKDIRSNTKLIEISQMQMLQPLVRQAEKNPCAVSDREWEEYELNYSTLFDLKVKYKKISERGFNIMQRLTKDEEQCVN